MPGRVYSAEDKAKVIAVLTANGGNVKRTARETGIAEQTVRNWKKQDAKGTLPATVSAAVPAQIGEFVQDAERIRGVALSELERKINAGEAKVGELNAVIGTLTDKINLARGQATSRQETVATGPSPEEFGAQLQAYLERAALASHEREADITDGEWEQVQGALPPAQS